MVHRTISVVFIWRGFSGHALFKSSIFNSLEVIIVIAVRGFLLAFSVGAGVLMALISLVFVGSTLMNEFSSLADVGQALVASAVLAALLAVPLAAVGGSSRSWQVVRTS